MNNDSAFYSFSTRMKTRLLVILILLVFGKNILGQQGITIQGKVVDTNHVALSSATIKLVIPTHKLTFYSTSVSDGSFKFEKIPSTLFTIVISLLGFKTYEKSYQGELF